MVIPRCSKHSSSGSAVTTEPRRSIMRPRAASTASRAASHELSRWRHPRRHRCGFFPARPSCKCLAHSLARLDCRSCSAAGWAGTAPPFTPSTRHVTNSGSRPSSDEPRLVPQARRDRFASACASSSLGPWSDDPSASVGGRERTLASAGDQGRLDDLVHASFSLFANRSAI